MTKETRNEFGEWLKHIRKKRRFMTLENVNTLTGFSTGFLSDIENGRKRIGPGTFITLTRALEIDEVEAIRAARMAVRDCGWKI